MIASVDVEPFLLTSRPQLTSFMLDANTKQTNSTCSLPLGAEPATSCHHKAFAVDCSRVGHEQQQQQQQQQQHHHHHNRDDSPAAATLTAVCAFVWLLCTRLTIFIHVVVFVPRLKTLCACSKGDGGARNVGCGGCRSTGPSGRGFDGWEPGARGLALSTISRAKQVGRKRASVQGRNRLTPS